MKRVARFALAAFAGVLVSFSALAGDKIWTGNAGDGDYLNPGNWNPQEVPENGSKGYFKSSSPGVTLYATNGTLVETSRTWVDAYVGSQTPRVFEIDCRGGEWVKSNAYNSAETKPAELFKLSTQNNAHLFNLESISTTADLPNLQMTNALFRYVTSSTNTTVELAQGLLNVLDPAGRSPVNQSLILGYSTGSGANKFIFREGSAVRAGQIQYRGATTAPGSELLIEGGDHYVSGTFAVKAASGSAPAYARMTGGKLSAGQVYVGNFASALGELTVTNDAQVVISSTMYCANASNSVGRLLVGGNATVKAASFAGGGGEVADGLVSVFDDAHLEINGSSQLGYNTWARQELRLRGRAAVGPASENSNFKHYLGYSWGATGVVDVADAARFHTAGDFYMGWSNKAYGELRVAGDAKVSNAYSYYVGYGEGSSGRFIVDDRAEVRGTCCYIAKSDGNATVTNALVQVNGGSFRMKNELTVAGVNCGFEVNGGVADIGYGSNGGGVVLGRGTPDCVSPRLSVTGGELYATNGSINVGVAHPGTVRLTGGRVRTQYMTSAVAGAVFHADGGVLEVTDATKATAGANFSSATLGAKGLVLRALCSSHSVSFPFTDAPGENGVLTLENNYNMSYWANCTHWKTRLLKGNCSLRTGVTQLGRNIEVAAGSTLFADDPSGMTCETLTLGAEDGAFTTIQLVPGGTVKVTAEDGLSILGPVKIVFNGSLADGDYTIFEVNGDLPEEMVDRLCVQTSLSGRVFAFAFADGKLKLSVKPAATPSDATWTGAQSNDWGVEGNWQGDQPPDLLDNAIFPAVASGNREPELDGSCQLAKIVFDSEDPYRLFGEGLIRALTEIEVRSGSHEIALAIKPFVIGGEMSLTKSGSGAVTLSGDNRRLASDLRLQGGVLEVADAKAFGDGNATAGSLLLGKGTLRYSGAKPCTVTRGLKYSNPDGLPVAVDVAEGSTLALGGSINAEKGVFVKEGLGELILDVSATGTGSYHQFECSDGDVKSNGSTQNAVVVPEDGEWTTVNGLAGVTVLDGTLRFRGPETGTAVVKMNRSTIIGANAGNRGPAKLVYDRVTADIGTGGFPLEVGVRVPSTSDNAPTVVALDSKLTFNCTTLGRLAQGSHLVYPTLAATNSTLCSSWGFKLIEGGSTSLRPRLILSGEGTRLYFNRSASATTFELGYGFAVEIADGAWLDYHGASGSYAGKDLFGANSYGWGTIDLVRDGLLGVNAILHKNPNQANGVDIRFDGGRLEFYTSNVSLGANPGPAKNRMTVLAGGGEIIVGAGISHTLAIPVYGEGTMTKSGAGTLRLVKARDWRASATTNATDIAVGQCAKTLVAAGTLELEAGSVSDAMAIEVASGATVDLCGATLATGAFSGAGRVTNGTLSSAGIRVVDGATADDVPVFDGVAFGGRVEVDFGIAPGESGEALAGRTFVIARLAPGTTPPQFRAVNKGRGIGVTFAVENGVVTATANHVGAIILVR